MKITLPLRIVLCGVSGAGKTTYGTLLRERFGYDELAYAQPLKLAAKVIFGFRDEDLWGPSKSRETVYPEFETTGFCFTCGAQGDGPERMYRGELALGRMTIDDIRDAHADDPTFWECPYCKGHTGRYVTVRSALETLGTGWGRMYCSGLWVQRAFATMNPQRPCVVTDCRFQNELRFAKDNGCCTVLLRKGLKDSKKPHPSEAEIRMLSHRPDAFDVVLNNETGSIEENFTALLGHLEAVRVTHRGLLLHEVAESVSPPRDEAAPASPEHA